MMEGENRHGSTTLDKLLNILVVTSVALGLFFLLKPNQPAEAQAPLNSNYAINRLQEMQLNEPPLYTELSPVDESGIHSSSTSLQVVATSSTATQASSSQVQSTVSSPSALQQILQNVVRVDVSRLRSF